MVQAAEVEALRSNCRFLAQALLRRGVNVEIFDFQEQVLRATCGSHVEWLHDGEPRLVPVSSARLADDKMIAKRVLAEAGLSVPRGNRFLAAQANDALLYAALLTFPVVVKPCDGRQGIGVRAGLRSMGEVDDAIDRLCRPPAGRRMFLVEKHVDWPEVRVFVTRTGAFAAALREPACVTGDGVATVAELMRAETQRRTSPRTCCLGPLALDDEVVWHLARAGLTPAFVPPPGVAVSLRSHVEMDGAMCEDATDVIHPSLAHVCWQALLAFPDLPFAGIDVRTRDPAGAQDAASYAILDMNSKPGLGLHIAPGRGRGRDIAGAVVDLLFPETADQRAHGLQPIKGGSN